MNCDCVDKINAQIADKNTFIPVRKVYGADGAPRRDTVMVQLAKLDSRKRKPMALVLPNFCPFCGKDVR